MLENPAIITYSKIINFLYKRNGGLSMSAIKEFYGGTSIDCQDFESVIYKGKIELKYYKIISNMVNKKNKNRKFGIEVVKKYISNNIVSEEKKEIFNCIESEDVADRVLELLKINKVSPINVVDVLQDLSSKRRCLFIK